jgi:hypothetical protein
MSVSHGSHHLRYQCQRAQIDYAMPRCQAFPVRDLDQALSELFLAAVERKRGPGRPPTPHCLA